MSSHRAVAALFLLNGVLLASWVPHIPSVQMALGLGDAALGVALLGMAAGALAAIALAGRLIPRLGSRAVVRISAVLFCVALPAPLLAPTLPLLFAALVVFGGANGAMDVSMNAQAVAVERRLGRPVLSSLHGLWSVGGLVGAGAAALALHAGLSPRQHGLLVVLLCGVGLAVALRPLLPPADDVRGDQRRRAPARGRLLLLGAMAAVALLAEGAIADWNAVYLRRELSASPATAALGFAAFQAAMAAGRFGGDRLTARVGDARLLGVSTATAALGLLLALLLGEVPVALAAFAVVGLGLSNVIPLLFRAAGAVPGVDAGAGIAAVGGAGYCGFLAGPPLIGLAAQLIDLPAALSLVVAALAAIAVGTRRL